MEKSKEQIVKNIDYMIGRQYDLSQKEKLTDEEVAELRGWSIKLEFLKMGGLDGMSLKEYLSLTERDWGDKAQKEIEEGKRQYDNSTEEENYR
jgi:hypothetical protein